MNIVQIKMEINRVESFVYFDSLYGIDIDGLLELRAKVKGLKENFLNLSFKELDVKDLEDIRFRLLEAGVSIAISIKEKRHEDIDDEISKLQELYRIAQTA